MMVLEQLRYLCSGLLGRIRNAPECPACDGAGYVPAGRKYFHQLLECVTCGLTYRYPSETGDEASAFYQCDYEQEGLTTSLPDEATLASLLRTRFVGSEKDFSHPIALLNALGVTAGMRVLDYGANWGYATLQFRQYGYDAVAFEISAPRAAFGEKLDVTVHTRLGDVGEGFDAVYSSHVLEHIPNPRASLEEQLGLLKPGGLVVGHTPNGSRARRERSPRATRANWGLVHPVLLTDRFISFAAGPRPFYVTSLDTVARVAAWDGASQIVDKMDDANLFFAIRA